MAEPRTLVDALEQRATRDGDREAFVFYADPSFAPESRRSITYGELWTRALGVAGVLQRTGRAKDRVCLVHDLGIDFAVAFFGTVLAGMYPVPVPPPRFPRAQELIQRLLDRTEARFVLHDDGYAEQVGQLRLPEGGVRLGATDVSAETRGTPATLGPDDVAVLQFTSGSTSEPKGVMQTHGNLLANIAFIRENTGMRAGMHGVLWLPHFHNAGLIYGIINSVVSAISLTLFPTELFVKRPVTWLDAITRFRPQISGAPNFAFDLCTARVTEDELGRLDLSSWELAINGAEPVSKRTIDAFSLKFAPCGFSASAMHPTYGLAEGTVVMTGKRRGTVPRTLRISRAELEQHNRVTPATGDTRATHIVSNGVPGKGITVRVVDPESRRPVPDGTVGEIWLMGPIVTAGYWNEPEKTGEVFGFHTVDPNEGPFLRTADLGCFVDGELYVIGRSKDVIVIGGENFHAADIERVVAAAHPLVIPNGAVALAINAHEKDALVLLVEAAAQHPKFDGATFVQAVRAAISRELQLSVDDVAVCAPLSLPRTPNGKIRRPLCRQLYVERALPRVV